MSNNCYHPSKGEMGEQNERLTNKHIQTLGFLQELSRGNKALKTRVEELEKECSECAELHAIAKDAKAKIQKIQEDCNRRVDQNNKTLTFKHEQEVMRLVSEKLEAENDWLQERDKVVHQRLDRTIAEVLELKKQNETLHLENEQLRSQVTGYKTDATRVQEYEDLNQGLQSQLEEYNQKIKELTFKVSHLQTELDGADEARNLAERNSAQDKLRLRILNLTRDLRAKENEVAEFDDLLREMRAQLQERTEQLDFELVQKEKLIMVIQRLEDELKARDAELQKRQSAKREQSPSFRYFVHMKREIHDLRDENEVLKQTNRKPLALPSLKAPSLSGDGKDVDHQSLSSKSTWSSKWNKR